MADWGDMEDMAVKIAAHAMAIQRHCQHLDVMKTLAEIAAMHDVTTRLAGDLVEEGARSGYTQKAMADALGVPASTLRGVKQAVRAT